MITEEQIAKAYWAFETPCQEYRKKTGDRRDASKCGDKKVAERAREFLILWEQWHKENEGQWVIGYPSGKAILFPDRYSLKSERSIEL